MISFRAKANISSTMEKFMSGDGMKESSMVRGNLSRGTKSRLAGGYSETETAIGFKRLWNNLIQLLI